MTKVSEITLSASMPSSMAILRFWAVARMALPMRVYLMNSVSAAMDTAEVTMISTSLAPMMCAMGSRNSGCGTRLGNGMKSEVWARMT